MSHIKLNVLTKGSEDSPALVLFHAFPFDSRMWNKQLEFFSKEFYCLAPDLPGFGSTPLEPDSLTFEAYVDMVLEFLKTQKFASAIWCGLSMGGYLALRLYERAPEFCRALVLCDTKAGADGNEAKLKRWAAVGALRKDREAFLSAQWNALVGSASRDRLGLRSEFDRLIASNDRAIVQGLVALATRTDSVGLLPNIKVPSLIVVGEDDEVTPVKEAEMMFQKIPGSKLSVLKGVGHLSHLEDPESFNKVLHDFISTL